MIVIKNGVEKKVSTGFSWKSLIFGIFYPIMRNDLEGVLYQFVLAFFTCGLSWFIIPFTYNKRYLRRLKRDGWEFLEGHYFEFAKL